MKIDFWPPPSHKKILAQGVFFGSSKKWPFVTRLLEFITRASVLSLQVVNIRHFWPPPLLAFGAYRLLKTAITYLTIMVNYFDQKGEIESLLNFPLYAHKPQIIRLVLETLNAQKICEIHNAPVGRNEIMHPGAWLLVTFWFNYTGQQKNVKP